MRGIWFLVLGLLAPTAAPAAPHDFSFGADLSFANEMDDCGAKFRDHGKPKDVFAIFKDHGATLVRVRLWHNPTWTQYSNLADVKKTIRRAKAQGLKVLLDIHYSDDWADAEHQRIPAAWAAIKDDDALAQTVYQYTLDTLRGLGADGLMPDMVQVGNETNGEVMMRAPSTAPIDWTRNAKLLNAGIRAVRAADPKIKVMLHIAQPENTEWWFGQATAAGITDFDVIGISYYAKWSKLNLLGLGSTINRLRYRTGKQVMVVETAYPWTTRWADNMNNLLGEDGALAGYRVSEDGQKQYLIDLSQTIIANGGSGVVYWAPDWVSTHCSTRWGTGSTWENATLFDFDGEALPGLDFMRATYTWPVTVTFAFHGLTPPPGQPFYLWGDFLGTKTFAVRLPEDGRFATTMMPGTTIRFQVFDGLELHARLLGGDKLINGFATETIPAHDTTLDYTLTKPQ